MMLTLALGASAKGIGVVAGFGASSLNITDFNVKSANCYNIGVAANCPLGLGFALQPELLFNMKAANVPQVKSAVTSSVTSASTSELVDVAKLGYLEVPVQVQWGLNLLVVRPYVFAEPFVGCAVSGLLEDQQITFNSVADRLEYGFGLGAGIDIFNKIQVSAKYFWNLDKNAGLNGMVSNVKDNINERAGFDGLVFSAAIFF